MPACLPKISVSYLTRHCLSPNISHPSPAPVLTIFAIFAASDTLDSTTATTIATTCVHSRLDYCNSLYHGLPITKIKRIQHIQNELARAVTRTPKHSHISPVLKSLHWLKVEQRIQYKIISITYNLLHIAEPKYLHRLINVQTSQQNSFLRSCVSFPSTCSTRLKFADRSTRNSSPRLWNSTNKSKILCY